MLERLRTKLALWRQHAPKLAQLKLVPKILDPKERWILQIALAVLLFVVAGGGTYFLSQHLKAVPLHGGSYREVVVGVPRFLNPILATSDVENDLNRLMYSSLLKYDNAGKITGDLAESFTLEEDGKVLRVVLRDNVFWHDGNKLTAEDVLFTIGAIKNPAWRSPLWKSLQGVEVKAEDERTIVIKSASYLVNFPDFFTFGILPKHIWEGVNPESIHLAVWNTKPIGSGPFQFKALGKSADGTLRFYRLGSFADYYGGAPYINEMIIEFVSDYETALSELREHKVDGIGFVPERLIKKTPTSGVQIRKVDFPRFTGLFFQDAKLSILEDTAVRRALSLALDRQALAALVPNANAVVAPFINGQLGFARTLQVPAGNLDLARSVLEGAGWKKSDEGWKKDKNLLSLTLTVLDESANLAVAEAVRKTWDELGVKVKVEAVSRIAFEQEVLRPRAFEVLLFSMITSFDTDLYPFWHSSQSAAPGLNLTSIRIRAADVALEKARVTKDPAERFSRYLEFQGILLNEVPAIMLYNSPYTYVISKRLKGFDATWLNTPADRFNSAEKVFVRSRLGWK